MGSFVRKRWYSLGEATKHTYVLYSGGRRHPITTERLAKMMEEQYGKENGKK